MSDPILELSAVHTDIAQYHILQGVDLTVPRGGVTMLLGRNGVGKTTTLRTIIGHWQAKSGSLRFNGAEITTMPTPARARAGIGHAADHGAERVRTRCAGDVEPDPDRRCLRGRGQRGNRDQHPHGCGARHGAFDPSWQPTGNPPVTYRQLACNLPATCRKLMRT